MLIFTCKTKPSQGSILESFWTGQHHILYHAPALMGEHYMVQSFIEQLSMARRGQPLCRNVKDKLQCNSWPPSYAEWLTEQAYFSVQMSLMLLTFYRATDLHFHQGCRLILFSAKLLAWDWQDRICLRDSHILIVQDKKKVESNWAKRSYCGLPSENVAVETEPVFREIQTSLQQNILLECTGIIYV